MNEQDWYFTFGSNSEHKNNYIKIYGTFDSARAEMKRRFGLKWGFQYGETGWYKDGISLATKWGLTEIH